MTIEDYDYEDYYEDEIEELTNEYLRKAEGLFKDSLKEKAMEIETLRKNCSISLEELKKREQEFELEKSRFEKHKNEQIYQMMKQFGLQFKPRQKVWVIHRKTFSEKCPCCEKGKITRIIDGENYETTCKKCNGRGFIDKPTIYEIDSGIISDICIDLYWNTKSEKIEENLYVTDSNSFWVDKLKFNLWSSECKQFSADEIYETEEEALAAVEKLRDEKGN